MDSIFNKVCVLVTAAFVLTLVPSFRRPERSLLSVRDRGTALLVFLLLGLVEEAAVGQTGWFNHRIIAVCAAGLLAGPGVGVVVVAFVTWMAVVYDGRPLGPVGSSMLCGGLAGGWLCRWRPSRPLKNEGHRKLRARRLSGQGQRINGRLEAVWGAIAL
jgi:LytS/YehU family sensor histidine kinase